MKDFTINQMLWHQKAVAILELKQEAEAWVKVYTQKMLENTSPEANAYYQEQGDLWTGAALSLQTEYYEALRQINEPILFKETREANVKQPSEANAKMVRDLLHVVDAAEEHSKQN